jgi:hypothetical protein
MADQGRGYLPEFGYDAAQPKRVKKMPVVLGTGIQPQE